MIPSLACNLQVPENFFIEATTGNCVGAGEYLGIETLWNNCNYWVNMQDCSHGIGVSMIRSSKFYHQIKWNFRTFKEWYYVFCFSKFTNATVLQSMGYDLGDVARWEFMFPHHDKPLLMLPGEEEFDIPIDEEEVTGTPTWFNSFFNRKFEIPNTVSSITLSLDFEKQ